MLDIISTILADAGPVVKGTSGEVSTLTTGAIAAICTAAGSIAGVLGTTVIGYFRHNSKNKVTVDGEVSMKTGPVVTWQEVRDLRHRIKANEEAHVRLNERVDAHYKSILESGAEREARLMTKIDEVHKNNSEQFIATLKSVLRNQSKK